MKKGRVLFSMAVIIGSGLPGCGGSATDSSGSGKDGGSGGDISTSSGGSENAGNSGGETATGSGGSGDPRAGENCEEEAGLACDSMNDRARLLCQQGEWAVDEVCGATEVCDVRAESGTFGLCVSRDEECDGYTEGDSFCEGIVAHTCAGSGLLEVSEECSANCVAGACETGFDACLTDQGCDGSACSTWDDWKFSEGNEYGACPLGDDQCLPSVEIEIPEDETEWYVRFPDANAECIPENNTCLSMSVQTIGIHLPVEARTRITPPPGWGMSSAGAQDAVEKCPVPSHDNCGIVPEFTAQWVIFIPLTADAPAGNAKFELVGEEEVCP